MTLLGSAINGTLCIYDYVGNTSVALWNLVTEEVKVIPPIIRKVTNEYCLHGFGYDHIRDDYKVIQYVDSYTFNDNVLVNECFWNIYSLNSNSWKAKSLPGF
jgi:F-box interacting protein